MPIELDLTESEQDTIRHYRNKKRSRFADHDNMGTIRIPYEVFKKLPYFTMEQLGIRGPDDYLPRWIGQYFIVRLKNGLEFLVNTECYRYCRYFAPFVAS